MDIEHPAPATLAVIAGRPPLEEVDSPVTPPVAFTATYTAPPGDPVPGVRGYGRWDNPTWAALETAVAELEGGGRALAFGSGMGAVAAVLDRVPAGGTLLIPRGAYNGTASLAARYEAQGRLRLRTADVADTAAVVAALDGADVALLESPTNPLLDVADIPPIVEAARAAGVLLAFDNTFATPLLQRPLDLGADVVVHSATKFLGGHSDVLLGALVTRSDELWTQFHTHRTLAGALPGPMEAYLVYRGIRTLALRVERACANAAELARRLSAHPAVEGVRHPSLPDDPGHARAAAQMTDFGAMIAIRVRGGAGAAQRTCSGTRLWVHATSLGGVESLLERRRRHPTESDAVPENLIRLSVGIEDVEDLWQDLSAALEASQQA